MSGQVVEVTDATFDAEVLESEVPVLVDFWAEWCGPCKAVAPILAELADEYAGRVKIAKVDVDANAKAAERYGVRAIPTLIFFKGGETSETKIGALAKSELKALIDSAL